MGNWTARIDFVFSHAADIFYPGGGGGEFDVLAVPRLETCVKLQISIQASPCALCIGMLVAACWCCILLLYSAFTSIVHIIIFYSKITIKEANPRLMHVLSAVGRKLQSLYLLRVPRVPSLD